MKPSLRFPEFKDEWQEKRLGDICAVNPRSPLVMPDKFYYIDLESVIDGRLTQCKKMKKSDAPSRAQRLLEKEDVLFQTVRPYQKNNLFFNKNGNFVASTGYAQLRANDSPSFLYQLLHTNNFIEKILVRCTGSNYPAINSEDMSTVSVIIPSRKEQEKIADFLRGGDERMVLLEKKVGAMREYKKGVMSAIFSGKLRFRDENGNPYPDWEERRLEDISRNMPSNITANNIGSMYSGRYIVYGASGEVGKVDNYQHTEAFTAIVKDGAGIGRIIWCEEKSSILGTLTAIYPKNTINAKFLYYMLHQIKFEKYATGSTIPHIYYKDFSRERFLIPVEEEQQKIADFLSAIDHKIELEQTRLDRTKDFKKGLLQRMFV